MVKYSNRGLSNDPSNLWLFSVLYWVLYLTLLTITQSILLGKFLHEERNYLIFSKQSIRFYNLRNITIHYYGPQGAEIPMTAERSLGMR